MPELSRTVVSVQGMDCVECTQHVRRALEALPGVASAKVSLSAEKAYVRHSPARVGLAQIRQAIEDAGYRAPTEQAATGESEAVALSRRAFLFFGTAVAVLLLVVVVGEWLGLLEALSARLPWPVWLAAILIGGYPVFLKVARAALRRQALAHTLMTVGALAAMIVGEWATAAVVVFFMRVGDAVEGFTANRSRRALRDLAALAPQIARIERGDQQQELPIAEVRAGDVVVVRPGELIPVDGRIIGGNATVDQSAITGESMPWEASPGDRVFAASIVSLGALRVEAERVGDTSTFGRVVRMVEEAETNRGQVQRQADRFANWYLPVVLSVAGLTMLISGDPLAAVAVLVVACSCSFALATPIAVVASIGAGARRGLLFKGGESLEALARAEVLLIDKTGTLTLGQPRISDVVPMEGIRAELLLGAAASAEWYSEHPLAEAIRREARERGFPADRPSSFEAKPGLGVTAEVEGHQIAVVGVRAPTGDGSLSDMLLERGKTVLSVDRDGRRLGYLAAEDTLRPETPRAIEALKGLGIRRIELLTGDHEGAAVRMAERLAVDYRANLLPEDKIAIVREYQDQGHTVVMVGDGINDAPALAQAHVGIAMGAAGTDIALEASNMALLSDNWDRIPEAFRIARRTMRVVRLNLLFTGLYNLVGLSLAAFGLLPPPVAAAAQSLPDLGILGNSSRLLRPQR